MKFLCSMLAIVALTCSAVLATSDQGGLQTSTIRAESIVLESPNGLHKITISADDDGSGIWLTEKDSGRSVCIYNLERYGLAVGIHGDKATDGYRAALAVTREHPDRGIVQAKDGEHLTHLQNWVSPNYRRASPLTLRD